MALPVDRRTHLEQLQWRFQLQLSNFAPTWVSGYDGAHEEPTASAMPWTPCPREEEKEQEHEDVPVFSYKPSSYALLHAFNHAQSIVRFLAGDSGDSRALTKVEGRAVRKEMGAVKEDVRRVGAAVEKILDGHMQPIAEMRNLVNDLSMEVFGVDGSDAKEMHAQSIRGMNQTIAEKEGIATGVRDIVRKIVDARIPLADESGPMQSMVEEWMVQLSMVHAIIDEEEAWFESLRNMMCTELAMLVDLVGIKSEDASDSSSSSSPAARGIVAKINDCLAKLSMVRDSVLGPSLSS